MKFDLQTILVIIGAVVLVFFPQIKAAFQSLQSTKPEEGKGEEEHTCNHAPHERTKAEWIQLMSDLQKQCHAAGYVEAEKLVCQLTTELVCNCNPPPVQEVQVTVTKAMA